MESIFEKLSRIDVNDHTEKKEGLTYLSWAWAWAEFKKACPDARYQILTFDNNLPYVYDPNTGYMVFTEITVGDETHRMWLPVMNGQNKAMKAERYTYDTKFKKGVVVEAATMFDINKTIMRCLVKNMALFGLGLYIYAGEDLPETDEETAPKSTPKKVEEPEKQIAYLSKAQIEQIAERMNNVFGDSPDKKEAFRILTGYSNMKIPADHFDDVMMRINLTFDESNEILAEIAKKRENN